MLLAKGPVSCTDFFVWAGCFWQEVLLVVQSICLWEGRFRKEGPLVVQMSSGGKGAVGKSALELYQFPAVRKVFPARGLLGCTIVFLWQRCFWPEGLLFVQVSSCGTCDFGKRVP